MRMRRLIVMCSLGWVAVALPAIAQEETTIIPITEAIDAEGPVHIVVSIYDAPQGGTLLFQGRKFVIAEDGQVHDEIEVPTELVRSHPTVFVDVAKESSEATLAAIQAGLRGYNCEDWSHGRWQASFCAEVETFPNHTINGQAKLIMYGGRVDIDNVCIWRYGSTTPILIGCRDVSGPVGAADNSITVDSTWHGPCRDYQWYQATAKGRVRWPDRTLSPWHTVTSQWVRGSELAYCIPE
jgi:hypothetical protein